MKGFTLVELLVVIAIIAILAAVVVLVINPLELTRRGRDAARLADLANLQSAITVAVQEASGSAAAVLCHNSVCTGKSTDAVNPRESDGTGWVKVDLSASKSVSIPTLPSDPTNTTEKHYTYCSDGTSWEIDAVLESTQQAGKPGGDGGDDTALYEVGTNLKLMSPTGTPTCTY